MSGPVRDPDWTLGRWGSPAMLALAEVQKLKTGGIQDQATLDLNVARAQADVDAIKAALAGSSEERSAYPSAESILQSIPRRQQSVPPDERKLWIPYVDQMPVRNTFWRSIIRFFAWMRVILTIELGNFFDQLVRRDTIERRAVRFRRALERAGGTFVKLGQQLAMRVDLLPWAYCVELSKMLDRMTPFSTEEALQAVARTIKRPWQEVFAPRSAPRK